ncbi:MAG: molybdenum cofactor biosynthesis protein MoaE [Candidatus Methanosuratincola verstraetei]|jgi:molybdopterin synthase catalytic subunit|uniref:Molybdenum cofactor biosynthesis protein MoaE n=2 Tax=Candidatus Methanosuratincola (ex Vanwonterghem et al. 2016) TaxID=1915412 RepID=A0A7J3UZN4_9CREN|nr:MAG: Molybdopterin synthase catalytic subunit MoaE [Candidatus Methanosuratincola subterraneus]
MPLGILSRKEEGFSVERLISLAKSSLGVGSYGALITFIGTVRGSTRGGSRVVRLEYEAYEESAKELLQSIAEDISKIDGVRDVFICHRYGTFVPGEEVLFVAVASERSDSGFEAVRQAVYRVKHEVPIWKKEITEDGGYWVGAEGA